jgi:biotin carboxyl carrier protein
MRIGRLILGLVIIAFALWVIVGEQITGVSSDAVINARLTTLRAPIAGRVDMPFRPFGARVVRGEEMATVTDTMTDTSRMNDLLLENDLAKTEAARLVGLADATRASMDTLRKRGETYNKERVAELELRLKHARERLALLEGGYAPDAGAAQLDSLADQGLSGNSGDSALPGMALSYARERVDVLEIALDAARQGVFLGDSYNDAPVSQQRLAELQTTMANLTAESAAAITRLAAVETRLKAERLRVVQLGSTSLNANANGVLWEVLAADGETVQRGQDVVRLMDCDTHIVTLSVPDIVYDRIRVGQIARFRLNNESEVYQGTVTRIAGSGAATIYENLAIAPSQKHLERFDVTLLVPALREDPALRCSVGRTGRAFFESRPLDWLRSLWR